MDYIYTICLLAALHMPTFSLGTDVTSIRERHSYSFISSSSYGFPDQSVLLAYNHWELVSLYQNNFADVDSG